MTIIDEILICANQLANAGKKPTVALVKAKLSQRTPLATLITTLKNWQHQPDFIAPLSAKEQQVSQDKSSNDNTALLDSLVENGAVKKIIQQSLAQELTEIKNELAEVKLLIKNLTEQVNQKK
ncbi:MULTISPECIES: hypothetical protein [Colwellia]|uniref:KfrA N-terminal DNA-binding domain-containing protein n=1 Tax=Colwellia marinimaniae TaxID=1513592 RepID=A0ABQ0MUN5_9GAMM|nr:MULTISPECIES: hypothetical protein [Colwellia]GAW96049.1 hypothetical protein MTCD1_01656 [Colwellia marinimaniae]